MSNMVIIGTQWGDEGKGKIVDLLCSEVEYIVRFQGGNNAGHTIIVNGNIYKLHLVPSGILHEKKICLIGNGVVLDPQVLTNELKTLKTQGVNVSPTCLKISNKAHLIMPYHKALDIARESIPNSPKIGTTGRGIGPCYEDKISRVGIRAIDITQPETLYKKITRSLKEKNILLQELYNTKTLTAETVFNEIMSIAPQIIPYLTNVSEELQKASAEGKRIMFEGAQGVHLDVDHGTYPFVTSSNTVAGNVSIGSGFALSPLTIIGVLKAYTTRVGEGPFPTELNDETGHLLCNKGKELGTTTGRPRRCGWQDIVMLRESARLNGFNELALTKLDVLSGLKELKLCISYGYKGTFFEYPPQNGVEMLDTIVPTYETMDGWESSLENINSWDKLPLAAKKYIERIETLVNIPITIISVGADRNQTIFRNV